MYHPLHRNTATRVPPRRNHLPIDGVAHRSIPLSQGLPRMPMINSHLISLALTVPPQSLMNNINSALKKGQSEALLDDWPRLFPMPWHNHHPPALNPRPFMGLNKFMASQIHQMRAWKGYLATHPTWRTPDANTSCPRCGLEHETFEHTILACLSRHGARSHLLHGVTSICQDAPLSSSLPLLQRLATFISVTCTGFPPTLFPPETPTSSPPLPLSPLAVPPPVFRLFR